MDDPASTFLGLFQPDGADPSQPFSFGSIALRLVAVAFLVALNGFFVAAEFALVGVRRSRVEALAAGGHRGARRVLRLVDQLGSYLSAAQLGITFASLGLGWIGEPAISRLLEVLFGPIPAAWRHSVAIVVAFSIITALHIVLGELAPKQLGIELAEKVALAVAWPMELFYKTFKLPIRMLDWAGVRTVRLFGLRPGPDHASIYTEEEIRNLIDLSQKSGHLKADEQTLIHSVFEFSDTLVREAMVPRTRMAAIPVSSSLQDVVRAFQQYGYSRLPVYRDSLDDIAGFIHSKDVMEYLLRPDSFRIEHVIQSPMYVVDTARLDDVLRQMQTAKAHFGFVIDEHGGVEGIITLEDLLEEIVGDISDEHDEEVNEQITEERDGTYLLDGGLAVRDLNKRLKLALPESDNYTTIAGFLMTEAGHVLQQGETVRHNGILFHVERVERRRIVSVRMETADERTDEPANGSPFTAGIS